ncbi:START domain-containing protein [Desulfosudis oleivorans]|uniref:START domain-containing protein n=1 Tax=Desulfosudis oleivorans (strain DSM 6200 / JCM 39069 / Hxd3) TaxID=96561 RepID=A8ZYB5_DESOH|nr:START domain-containing protein [Desulfosudis oleivorans]ABW67122.1 hypothetical protein Dole_1318 [Desulfosudis oleivorans Hxd3]
MKHFFGVLFFLLFISHTTLLHADIESDWVLTNESNNIKTYQRVYPGSKLLQFKAICVIDARAENFGQVLRDLEAMPLWMDMCEKATLISEIDENNRTLHILLDLPVVKNRDLVVKTDTVYDLDRARGIVDLSMVKDSGIAVPRGVVRLEDFSGSYVFEYITREKTGLIYTYYADPGGLLPAFLVNFVGKHMLYNTFQNLGRMVQTDKYVEAAKHSKDRQLFESILSDPQRVKTILKNRLMEYCRNETIIDRAVNDPNIVDLLINGDGVMMEQVFLSWGSREMLEKAMQTVLRTHARQYTTDEMIIDKIANNQELIDAIIDGDQPGRASAVEMIQAMLN